MPKQLYVKESSKKKYKQRYATDMQNKELSKLSPLSLLVMAVVVFISSTVSIVASRLFNSADSVTNDHFTLANLSETVRSIVKSVDAVEDKKLDKEVFVENQKRIDQKLDNIEKNQKAQSDNQKDIYDLMQKILSKQQASINK